MSRDPLEELLLNADHSAPKIELRPPRLADLERRRRMQIARRAGLLLSILALVTSTTWISAARDGEPSELSRLHTSTESLTHSLAELGEMLASLGADPEPTASSASEEAALATFRALHRGAERGEAHSIQGMRWLAQSFSTTRGGRCAQLFLATDAHALQGAGPSFDPYPTKR